MEKITEYAAQLNEKINGVVWGAPMLLLMLFVGLVLTLRTGAVQLTHFGCAMRNTIGRVFRRRPQRAGRGAVTPFQAMTTALAATMGTGNIVGVSQAIALGGPGAVFWMWAAALIGMCTKYAEVVLAVRYRRRNRTGDWVGGPMYYITAGLGRRWSWLSTMFCVFGALAAFGIGNIAQGNNITGSVCTAIRAFSPEAAAHMDAVGPILGILLAVLVGLVLLGGLKGLGSVTEKLIPFVSVVYIFSALAVILAHAERVVPALASILQGAFHPSAAAGGAVGFTVSRAVSWGFRRGVFSNEAGLGSAPIAHAAAETDSPVLQGFYGIFEVFADTIVVCSLTALALLTSGVDIPWGAQLGSELVTAAFATLYGDRLAAVILAVSTALFAFSTILSWSLYGKRCVEHLTGRAGAAVLYQILFVAAAAVGAMMDLSLAWEISDTLNGLMALPNLAALLALSGVVARLTKEYFRSGTLR